MTPNTLTSVEGKEEKKHSIRTVPPQAPKGREAGEKESVEGQISPRKNTV